MIEGLLGKLAEVADPAALVELLLFGNPTLNSLLASSTVVNATKSEQAMAKRPETRRSKLGSLKKTFAALKALGRRFAKALEGLHERVQQPMQDARIYTSTRPALSTALGFAASHVYEIKELMTAGAAVLAMVDPQERQTDPSAVDRYRAMLGDEQADFGRKIHGIVGRLATLELPEKVVDITGAVQFIIAEMVAFVGKRLGLQGKVVVIILEGSGALDYFAGKVAHEIVARGFDPNVYWRDEVIPQVSDSFNSARDSLVKSLNELLAKPAFDQMFTPIGKGEAIVLEPDAAAQLPEPGADTQPAAAADRSLVPRPARVPVVGAGSPLTEGARTELEAGFGSDLRHVRLHDGGDGEAMTAAFGADALTSGSHVFLRAGLHAERGRGREVMQHEVAHVLQQTGPRPPGSLQSALPAPARPERGLMVDPASESEAHRMAAEVRARLGGGAPATGIAARAVEGMQPYTVEDLDPYLLARSLRALNRLEQIKQQELAYEQDKTLAKLDRSEDAGAVSALVKAFSAVTKKSSQLVVKAPKVFQGRIDVTNSSSAMTLDKILAELGKNLDPKHLEVVASHIMKEAQDLVPQPKTKGKKTPTPKARYVNPSHFARQLEGYVLGKTGVGLALRMKTRDFKAPDGSTLKEIDPSAPLASVEVLHLYLPYVAPNSDLAVFAITNTWPDARTDDKRRAKLAATARSALVGMGIRATVWALFGDAYKFSILFKKQVDDLMTANLVSGGPLDPNQLTRPDVYASSGLTSQHPVHIGTRVATYGHASQVAPGRHSHHLTQFLVAEYFANRNEGKQPFKKDAKLPGVTWNNGVVTHISPDPTDKTKGIQVANTYGSDSSPRRPDAGDLARGVDASVGRPPHHARTRRPGRYREENTGVRGGYDVPQRPARAAARRKVRQPLRRLAKDPHRQ
ncbi:DUF4157 domain-containing protein [Polaromonas sp. P1(28)-8]|nr:DUF4157 domain-containing protein [Polaromonas sp. P1(28)-8]